MRFLLVTAVTVTVLGCSARGVGPTAPSTRGSTGATTTPSTRGNLKINWVGVNDAGQSARDDWQYNVTVNLSETGGVDMTVTHIEVQALVGSDILATASVIPVLPISAKSTSDARFVFAADTHVGDLRTLTVNMTIQFRDANGDTGSVSNVFSCFGCWDY